MVRLEFKAHEAIPWARRFSLLPEAWFMLVEPPFWPCDLEPTHTRVLYSYGASSFFPLVPLGEEQWHYARSKSWTARAWQPSAMSQRCGKLYGSIQQPSTSSKYDRGSALLSTLSHSSDFLLQTLNINLFTQRSYNWTAPHTPFAQHDSLSARSLVPDKVSRTSLMSQYAVGIIQYGAGVASSNMVALRSKRTLHAR